MSSLKVFDKTGAAKGEVKISDDLLTLTRGTQALKDVVVAYRNAGRGGNASTKNKSAVAGTGAKPWAQKGTGRARAGYKQSPIWRGGGVAFGPHPRSYEQKVNRKTAQLAFRRAASEKIAGGGLRVIDGIEFEESKTKYAVSFFKSLEVTGPVLLVLAKAHIPTALAVRNLKRVEIVEVSSLNTYQLLRYPTVLIDKDAVPALEGRLGKESEGAA